MDDSVVVTTFYVDLGAQTKPILGWIGRVTDVHPCVDFRILRDFHVVRTRGNNLQRVKETS